MAAIAGLDCQIQAKTGQNDVANRWIWQSNGAIGQFSIILRQAASRQTKGGQLPENHVPCKNDDKTLKKM
ncbi:MAG: hypothetical protein ACOYYJ_07900 [Chloroflexota bacterium]